MKRGRTRARWSRMPARLFWRVYLNGLLLLVLVGLALFAVAAALGRAPPGRNPERFAGYVAVRASELRDDPVRLREGLQRLRDTFGAEVTVYRRGGVLASNVTPPLPPLGSTGEARLPRGPFEVPGRRFTFAAPLEGNERGYVLVSGSFRSPSILRGVSFVGAVLLALVVASIPLARAISAPLERLGRAVRAFGGGDLSARARLRAAGEVGEVAAAFDQMADRIEGLLRGERELLANVSHELRTPLARIRVALDLAAEGDLERARRYLAEIGTDLDDLERLVADVLTTARLELAASRAPGATLPIHAERLDVRALVLRAAEQFQATHPERTLEVELADGLPAVDADRALLRRVVDNLLDNARKYSDAGSPITLGARPDDGGVEIEVRDRGIGIDPADLGRLFTPFFRSDRSRARGSGGVGLGLALARRIVEAHGGRIEAASSPGEGTRIGFSIPAAPQAPGR